MSNSAAAVCGLSANGKRYVNKDLLLKGFAEAGGYWTAKEVAKRLGWDGERYHNAPKRLAELIALGYVIKGESRKCGETGQLVTTCCVTDKGRQYLRDKGLVVKRPERVAVVALVPCESRLISGRAGLAGVKSLLG